MDRARYCVPKSPAQHPRQADSLPYARWIDGIHELTRMDTNRGAIREDSWSIRGRLPPPTLPIPLLRSFAPCLRT